MISTLMYQNSHDYYGCMVNCPSLVLLEQAQLAMLLVNPCETADSSFKAISTMQTLEFLGGM